MKMNQVETALMNNPVRAAIQRWYEAPLLKRLGGSVDGMRTLEVGCGRGVGTEIILDSFGARQIHAFDLDPYMVNLARQRLAHFRQPIVLTVGDVTAIAAADGSFDAVFDFGIIHHVPDWRNAVSEVARVLKAGGRFFFEEVTLHALERWSYRTFLDHPKQDRFSGEELVAEIERAGIEVGTNFVHRVFGDFVIGVGRKDQTAE
jgi:ubiquinone/menaquinone biosynthesis C-methylase UbiE